MTDADYVERLDAFASGWQAAMDDDLVSEVIAVIDGRPLCKSDLDGALDELERLRAERGGPQPVPTLGNAYANGWYDALAALQTPGWDEREAGWRKFIAAVEAHSPQQPECGGMT